MPGLVASEYLKFPFSVGTNGPLTSKREKHVREQIEQVLFTNPGERVFRPEFGVGVRRLVFEPNNSTLRNTTINLINSSLEEALFGEVDPNTLHVEVDSIDAKLIIRISYTLAAINKNETHEITISSPGGNNG